MRPSRIWLLTIVAAALTLSACVDRIPSKQPLTQATPTPTPQTSQANPSQRIATAQAPRDVDQSSGASLENLYTYLDVQRFSELMLETLAAERLWCDEQPRVAELREMLGDHAAEEVWRSLLSPTEGEDLRVIEIVAEATAEARGIPLGERPPVYLVSRTTLRFWSCLTEEIWEHDEDWALGLPANRLAALLGQTVEAYGELEQSWLSGTLWWGWYGELAGADELPPGADGAGEIVLVSNTPIPEIFVEVIAHELVHYLQDQWTDWRLHDWFRDAETTDQLEALRWVVEGDATLNELYGHLPPLVNLLSEIEWGPEKNAEYGLWQRAAAALSPQDSESLFAAYEQGSDVLWALRNERGQEAIDALLLEPPASTEQLIHAEKLENDEQPIQLVDLHRLRHELFPVAEWEPPVIDRMGEQWLRSLIATASGRPDLASEAASGWGSDQMTLWRSREGDAEVVTWQVVFDDADEHREGVDGLRRWFSSHTAIEARSVAGNMLSWDGPTGAARLITRPRAVWLVASSDPEIADEVAQHVRSRIWTNYWSTP